MDDVKQNNNNTIVKAEINTEEQIKSDGSVLIQSATKEGRIYGKKREPIIRVELQNKTLEINFNRLTKADLRDIASRRFSNSNEYWEYIYNLTLKNSNITATQNTTNKPITTLPETTVQAVLQSPPDTDNTQSTNRAATTASVQPMKTVEYVINNIKVRESCYDVICNDKFVVVIAPNTATSLTLDDGAETTLTINIYNTSQLNPSLTVSVVYVGLMFVYNDTKFTIYIVQ